MTLLNKIFKTESFYEKAFACFSVVCIIYAIAVTILAIKTF